MLPSPSTSQAGEPACIKLQQKLLVLYIALVAGGTFNWILHFIKSSLDRMKVVAVAEPVEHRRKRFLSSYQSLLGPKHLCSVCLLYILGAGSIPLSG